VGLLTAGEIHAERLRAGFRSWDEAVPVKHTWLAASLVFLRRRRLSKCHWHRASKLGQETAGAVISSTGECTPPERQISTPRIAFWRAVSKSPECHGAAEIDVKGLVSNPHRTSTQFDRSTVFARHQLIMLKSLQDRFRSCRLGRIPGSRKLVRRNRASNSLAKHADRTEFHCSRKLVTATRAGTLGLCTHAPNRPSHSIETSQRAWISSSACSAAACESSAWL
jgi:hypothetical protein